MSMRTRNSNNNDNDSSDSTEYSDNDLLKNNDFDFLYGMIKQDLYVSLNFSDHQV